jgi:hypothetical protein
MQAEDQLLFFVREVCLKLQFQHYMETKGKDFISLFSLLENKFKLGKGSFHSQTTTPPPP